MIQCLSLSMHLGRMDNDDCRKLVSSLLGSGLLLYYCYFFVHTVDFDRCCDCGRLWRNVVFFSYMSSVTTGVTSRVLLF